MDAEEDRAKPPGLPPDEQAAEENNAVADPQPLEQTSTAMTSAEAATSEEFTASSNSPSQNPVSSAQEVAPTPSGPTEPTRNVEIELPPGWNENRPEPSEPSASNSAPASGPTEPSRHAQIEVPSNWDGSDLTPSEPSADTPAAPHSSTFPSPTSPSSPLPSTGRSTLPAPSSSSRSRQSDRERRVPSIVVTVSLGHSRDMFEQAVEAAIQSATQKFHKIAKQEIDLFAFEQRAARRAADYRLRGPNPQ